MPRFYIVLKHGIDLLDCGGLPADGSKPIAGEGAYVVAGVLLDLIPVPLVVFLLHLGIEAHKDEVADLGRPR